MELEQHLKLVFMQKHPWEAARHLESLSSETAGHILMTMEADVVAEVLEYFLPGSAAQVLLCFSDEMSANIIGRLTPAFARAVLRQFDSETRAALYSHFDPAIGSYFRRTLQFPEHTVGSLADPRVLTLPPDITVAEALRRIGQECRQAIYYLYVIDRSNTLKGVLVMKELLAASTTDYLESVMNQNVTTIPASANAQDLISHPAWQVFDSLPVVEQGQSFVGVLRYRALRKFTDGSPDEAPREFFSDALLQLWEAYSLSGISLMTTLGDVLKATYHQKPFEDKKETS